MLIVFLPIFVVDVRITFVYNFVAPSKNNRLNKYLKETIFFMKKKLGFQIRYSTNDAIVQLVYKICGSFEKGPFTLGVFIDLSKVFDGVEHFILLKKIELYGITDKNFAWFESYLSNRKQ